MTAPLYYTYPFAVSGTKTTVPQVYANNNQISYQDGWTAAYALNLAIPDSGALPISLAQTNQMFYDATSNIQQYQLQGTPNWYAADANSNPIPYPKYARIIYTDGNVYESQITSNTNVPGTDGTWLVISGTGANTLIGEIIDFAGTSVPTGFLNCDGASYLRATYPNLFTAIGTTWGSVDGTHFNVPDLRGYGTAGSGGSLPPLANTVGSVGGTATTTQLVSHTHTASIGSGTTTTGTDGNNMLISSQAGSPHAGSIIIASTGTGSSATIVQPTAITMKLIKY